MKNEDLDSAQDMLNEKMMDIEDRSKSSDYQAIELRLTDADGNVLVKGGMRVSDMMALEELQGVSKGKVMEMFYFALEDDLKTKNNGK